MAAALGLIAWAAFGLPALIVPFITPSPAVLAPIGAVLTAGEAALIISAARRSRSSR
jgi:hypothetical protein